ncbi:MAG: phosphoglycerate mutase, partial [Candidatus Saccharibacteria bacterium]
NGGPEKTELTPPHDISDRIIGEYLPKGAGAAQLLELMQKSNAFLPEHPINHERIERGERPATSLWFWGQGRKPAVQLFADKYGLKGSVISAVDLTKGLGIAAGMRSVDVPGATGNITTDFRGKALAALKELKNGQDFVYIHVEAPDEAGHRGELETKIKAIEEIDEKVLGELLAGLEQFDDYRILLLPDHPTPMAVKTHVADPVPFMIYQKSRELNNGVDEYSEESAQKTGLFIEVGSSLMDRFLER